MLILLSIGVFAVDVVEVFDFETAVFLGKDCVTTAVREVSVGVGVAEIPVYVVGFGECVLALEG